MARILLIPGTKWQQALGEKILQTKNELYVVSPENDAPCKEMAQGYYQSDIFNVEGIEQFAKDNCIDAIVSDECDIAMPVVAELGERLHYHTLSREAAALYTNKYLMRKHAEHIGLSVPEFQLCHHYHIFHL